MNVLDRRRLGQHQDIRASLYRVAVVRELLTPPLRFVGEPEPLHHRPHGSVEHHDAAVQCGDEVGSRSHWP